MITMASQAELRRFKKLAKTEFGLNFNSETYFYREASQLKFLTEFLVPKIRAARLSSEPIRILSLGCSIGAEPYSIAMALQEKFGAEVATREFTILGADVDVKAIEKARMAHYDALAFRSLSISLKQRYFIEEKPSAHQFIPPTLVLKPEIRNRVSFHELNIISDKISSKLSEIDIIFFRNVSIYFDEAARLLIQKKIISMLKLKAYLLVGLTESMSNNFGLLTLKNEADIFYFVKDSLADKKQNHLKLNSLTEKKLVETTAKKINTAIKFQAHTAPKLKQSPQAVQQGEIKNLLVNKDYEGAMQLLQKLSTDQQETAEHLLLRAFILFNRQDFDEARQFAEKARTLSPLTVDIFLLLGMISKWQQQTDEAIQWLKKALYIHVDCWPAHYYLAGLYRETGHSSKAAQEYRLVIQQLDNPEENFCSKITIPLFLPKAEIRLLSQSHLKKITNSTDLAGGKYNGY